MTQQPYSMPYTPGQPPANYPPPNYAPPAPQQPAQPFVYGPPAQVAPQPYGYGQPPTQYGQQPGYGQQPPVPQGPPPVQGTVAAFDNQPTGGNGPGLSFKNAPLGTTYAGTVTRDVRDGDVIQDTDFTTKLPLTFRDGRPRLVMVVPLQLDQPDAQHPDGAASLHVRTGIKDAISDAMAQIGATGAPKGGDHIVLTLVDRKNTGQGNPKSVYHVTYTRDGQTSSPAPQVQQPGYGPQPGQPQYQQVPPQYQQVPPQPYGQPAYPQPNGGYPAPAPQPTYPVQEPTRAHEPNTPQPPVTPEPVQQAPQPPAAPAPVQGLPNLSPEQQAFLAQLQAGQGQS